MLPYVLELDLLVNQASLLLMRGRVYHNSATSMLMLVSKIYLVLLFGLV